MNTVVWLALDNGEDESVKWWFCWTNSAKTSVEDCRVCLCINNTVVHDLNWAPCSSASFHSAQSKHTLVTESPLWRFCLKILSLDQMWPESMQTQCKLLTEVLFPAPASRRGCLNSESSSDVSTKFSSVEAEGQKDQKGFLFSCWFSHKHLSL